MHTVFFTDRSKTNNEIRNPHTVCTVYNVTRDDGLCCDTYSTVQSVVYGVVTSMQYKDRRLGSAVTPVSQNDQVETEKGGGGEEGRR